MKIIEYIMTGFIFFLIGLTAFFWRKQRKLKKKRRKDSKYEVVEVSELDQQYYEYYEPQIIEVVSSDEFL